MLSMSRALVLAVLVVPLAAGCGSSSSSSSAPGASTTGSSSAAASSSAPSPTGSSASASPGPTLAPVAITATVKDGTVTPAAKQYDVPLGSPVHIEITSDVKGEIHVHGYEIEKEIEQDGGSVSIDFVADTAGIFEVESHESDLLLFKLSVS
jgi:cytoskeletal protein RodZ